MTGITATIVGSLIIAAVSTLGDFVWATWLPEHRAAYGLIHGTLLFCAIGLFLGVLAARPAVGAAGGALIGALAAGAFYLLAPLVGYSAMFVAWVTLWMTLGLLYAGLCGSDAGAAPTLNRREVLVRGAVAAVASGLALYLIFRNLAPLRSGGMGLRGPLRCVGPRVFTGICGIAGCTAVEFRTGR